MKRQQYLWLLIPVFVLLIVFFITFGDMILIRFIPKAVLSTAVTSAYSQLESRFANDPILLFTKVLNSRGQYAARINLETENQFLGTVRYDMTVSADEVLHRFQAEGIAETETQKLDLTLYLDSSFMSVSSQSVAEDKTYGITYDTFASDIRSIPLLNYMITDAMIEQWDNTVNSIQNHICMEGNLSGIPEISDEMLQGFLLGILALPCEVENRTVSKDSKVYDCQVVSYFADDEMLNQLLPSQPQDKGSKATVSFYLCDNLLVEVKIHCQTKAEEMICSLWLGEHPATDPLSFHWEENCNGADGKYDITIKTIQNDTMYEEFLEIIGTCNGTPETCSLDYNWDLNSNALTIRMNDEPEPVKMILSETEAGFQIDTTDFRQLVCLFAGESISKYDGHPIQGSITLSRGSDIQVPEYINLDQWSLEDFWILLNELGALAGIQLGI